MPPRNGNDPWYWEARVGWHVNINGKRYKLGKDKNEAFEQFYKLKAEPKKRGHSGHGHVPFFNPPDQIRILTARQGASPAKLSKTMVEFQELCSAKAWSWISNDGLESIRWRSRQVSNAARFTLFEFDPFDQFGLVVVKLGKFFLES